MPETALTTATRNSKLIEFYIKFENLAHHYANQVFNYERHGYEREDVVQDFKIKLYTSLIAYSEKWTEYKNTGKYKPVPIEFYLKSAMANKVKDFIRKFNLETVENVDKISLQNSKFDYGHYTDMGNELNYEENCYVINGVDLLYGLVDSARICFILFLRGFPIKDLRKKFRNLLDAETIITRQLTYLHTQKTQLLDYRSQDFKVFYFED